MADTSSYNEKSLSVSTTATTSDTGLEMYPYNNRIGNRERDQIGPNGHKRSQQPVVQGNSLYVNLEPATTTAITTTPSELTSADNIPNLVVSSKPAISPRSPGSQSQPKRKDTSVTPADLGGRKPYAIPPRRIPPRPPPKPFQKSSTPPNDKNTATPSVKKFPPVLRQEILSENPKPLSENQLVEKKQSDDREKKKVVADSYTTGHMKPRVVNAAVTRKPYINETSPSSPRQSDKKRNLSNSTMSKSEKHLDESGNGFANQ
ncbi:rho GTPase-activating protein gacJ-like [Dysidea avara]|uniref:rho GTPase-activating protein gacJ-like n=1 Tax=Dysidea avara TaxID=196820 RepID=UPI00331C0C08